MKSRITKAIAIAGVGLSALAATAHVNAATTGAVDACIARFVADHLADHPGKITINKNDDVTMPTLTPTGRQIVHVVAATKSGSPLASVTCIVSARGIVVSMRPMSPFAMKSAIKLAHQKQAELATKDNDAS